MTLCRSEVSGPSDLLDTPAPAERRASKRSELEPGHQLGGEEERRRKDTLPRQRGCRVAKIFDSATINDNRAHTCFPFFRILFSKPRVVKESFYHPFESLIGVAHSTERFPPCQQQTAHIQLFRRTDVDFKYIVLLASFEKMATEGLMAQSSLH